MAWDVDVVHRVSPPDVACRIRRFAETVQPLRNSSASSPIANDAFVLDHERPAEAPRRRRRSGRND